MDLELTFDIFEEVAHITGTDLYELPPITEKIDPEAIEQLLRCAGEGVTVSFEYAERSIVIRSGPEPDVDVTQSQYLASA